MPQKMAKYSEIGTDRLSPIVFETFGPQNENKHINKRTNEPTNKRDRSHYLIAEVKTEIS